MWPEMGQFYKTLLHHLQMTSFLFLFLADLEEELTEKDYPGPTVMFPQMHQIHQYSFRI